MDEGPLVVEGGGEEPGEVLEEEVEVEEGLEVGEELELTHSESEPIPEVSGVGGV